MHTIYLYIFIINFINIVIFHINFIETKFLQISYILRMPCIDIEGTIF